MEEERLVELGVERLLADARLLTRALIRKKVQLDERVT